MNPIRVLIVDDHPIVLVGISAIVGAQPDLAVVGQTGNGQEAIRHGANSGGM